MTDYRRWMVNDACARELFDRIPVGEPLYFHGTRIYFDDEPTPVAAGVRAVLHRPEWLAEWNRRRNDLAASGFEVYA